MPKSSPLKTLIRSQIGDTKGFLNAYLKFNPSSLGVGIELSHVYHDLKHNGYLAYGVSSATNYDKEHSLCQFTDATQH